ncbi:MAG: helix-turn-helix domain-containing protein [Terriglobales bacterium]
MPSFGEKLKQGREKRQITLEQISNSTKIGTRMLQALEEDKFNQLPGGIFNKGFVRAYARFVGLDEDQTVADYLQASGEALPGLTEIAAREDGAREHEETVSRLEAISDAPARQVPWGLFAAVLLLIALALSLWSHRQRERARQSLHPTPTTAVMPLPAAPPSGQASGKISNGDNASGLPTTGSPTRGSATVVAPQTPPYVAAAVPAATPGEFTVVIQAREESWISVTADGKTVPSEILAAGSERAITGRQEIIIKVGNAGGIDFRFNGKKLATGGELGEVKTVTFGPGGMVPNAPSPPSTP